VGDTFEPRVFSTWCPKAIAMIGELPDTLADRSIQIRMRRRAPGEVIERFRLDRLSDLRAFRQQAARWVRDAQEQLRGADPHIPDALHDRAADNWRPLLAIADLAGGPWPARARTAVLRLSGEAVEEAGESPRTLLLGDLRTLFTERGANRLSSSDIVAELKRREDRPWPEWSHGRGLSARGLAHLLKPFGIGPRTVREGGTVVKGYIRADFFDAWGRYLPCVSVTSVTSLSGRDLRSDLSVTSLEGVTGKKTSKVLGPHDVTDVTDGILGSDDFERGDAWEAPDAR
jgi:putative DNA primase/helicase